MSEATPSQPDPVELAKQGNLQAISFLINRSLKSKGITAKVLLKDGLLQVLLEAAEVPEQAALASFIHRGVTSLGVASIKDLRVYGRKTGEGRPAWSQEFQLVEPVEIAQVKPTPQPPSPQGTRQDQEAATVKEQSPAASDTAKAQQGCIGCLAVSLIIIFGLYIFGLFVGSDETTSPASSDSSQSAPAATEKPPEELLAIIDYQPERESDYATLLDQLGPQCQEDRMRLADMSVATQELLTKKGAKANNLEILNAVYQAVKPFDEPQKCAAAFALTATLVNK